MEATRPSSAIRKRKADNQDNERLSKRLSLLNLERNGQKLYVPVEAPSTSYPPQQPTNVFSRARSKTPPKSPKRRDVDGDMMQMDDTAHKVYIYDLDAELSSSDSDSDSPSTRLIFPPSIRKHLQESRIPKHILANKEGELAGHNMELVLYNVPSSLSVPEERDSVRKAIIEARARARKAQAEERRINGRVGMGGDGGRREWGVEIGNNAPREMGVGEGEGMDITNGISISNGYNGAQQTEEEYDPDAMDLG